MILLTIAVVILNDIKIEDTDRQLIVGNKELMKIIHDLKNPLIAMNLCVDESKLEEYEKDELKNEIEDMTEMLDTLKTEFKTRNDMKFNENKE